MKYPKTILVSLALLFLLPAGQAAADEPQYVPGEVLVKFKAASPSLARVQALNAVGAASSEPIGLPRTRRVELVDENANPHAVARRLEKRAEVVWAEPNYIARTLKVRPNDPLFTDGSLWGLFNSGQPISPYPPGDPIPGLPGLDIGAIQAWERTTGSREILVGVADTGIASHPDLDANVRDDLSRDFRDFESVEEERDTSADSESHGTHVAGTIGAVGDNGIGVTGINWQAGLVNIRVLDAGWGTVAGVAAGFAYAGQLGLRVVNASLLIPAESQAIEDAIRLSPGTLFVGGSGNGAKDHDARDNEVPSYPCDVDLPNVICVAAIDNRGSLADFSDYGVRSVDLAAPGVTIQSTVPTYSRVDDLFARPGDFNDNWSTGSEPPGHPWEIDDSGDKPILISGPLVDNLRSEIVIAEERPISLVGKRGCSLQGRVNVDFGPDSSGSKLVIEYSRDLVSWFPAAEFEENGEKQHISHSLHADGVERLWLSIRLAAGTDVDPTAGGVSISDLHVRCLDDPGPTGSYEASNGTSMATPHVAGAAALLLAKRPELTVAELRDALLTTVRPLPSLAGKTVTGGMLDLAAAMAAVEKLAPKPKVKPRLAASIIPGARLLRRTRGVVFRVTSSAHADVTARAVISWRGGGRIRLRRLVGGRPSAHNRKARLATPGRMTKMTLRPTGRQLRRLLRIQRSGRNLRVRMVVRVHSREHRPVPLIRRNFRLR